MQKEKQNFKVQLWITVISLVLFVIKIAAYYFTYSLAILTDALESVVNVLAGFIGLYSLYVAAKPRDMDHPYGHGKAEFISAAAEGSLIVASGIFIAYETIQNIIKSNAVGRLDTGIMLIAITALVNYVAGFVCLKVGKKNNSLALQASGRHLQIDTYSTFTIIISLYIMLLTHWLWVDRVIAGIMSILIIFNGYKILRSSLAGIMDEADKELLLQLVELLNANRRPNWVDLHNLRVIKYGATLHVDCHLTVPWYLNVNEAHKEIDALSDLIRNKFGDALELFVHTDGCIPFSCSICTKNDCTVRQHDFVRKIEWSLENIITNHKHGITE